MPGNSVALGEHTKSAFQIVIRGYRRDDLRGTEEYITYNHTKYYISKGMFYRLWSQGFHNDSQDTRPLQITYYPHTHIVQSYKLLNNQ